MGLINFTRYLLALLAAKLSPGDDCTTLSSPNPIARDYPTQASGNLNGTTLIVPIPIAEARKVIPEAYAIRTDAYRELLPDFPEDMYPMMAVGNLDHDVQFPAFALRQPDFQRAGLEFPFVDIFGDGSSSFRWAATMMITAGSPAIIGSEGYGIEVFPAAFDPPCDAYAPEGTFAAATSDGSRHITIASEETTETFPYTIDFLRNITNQVVFAETSTCDNYKRLFNTTLTTGENEPVQVKADVGVNVEPLLGKGDILGVFGWRISTAFLEPPFPSDCESLKGYAGTGPGDSG